MGEISTRYIVRTDGTRAYHLVLKGGSFRWMLGDAGRMQAHYFTSWDEAQAQIDKGRGGAGGDDAHVVRVRVQTRYVIVATGARRSYCLKLVRGTERHRWVVQDTVGMMNARRFEEKADAKKVCAQDFGGAGRAPNGEKGRVVAIVEVVD